MNWFQRHLNWTLLIGLFIGSMLYTVANMVSWYVLLRVGALAVMLVAQVWYLSKKGRSLGWLFLVWLLGGLAYAGGSHAGIESAMFCAGLLMLCLKNKKNINSKELKDPSTEA